MKQRLFPFSQLLYPFILTVCFLLIFPTAFATNHCIQPGTAQDDVFGMKPVCDNLHVSGQQPLVPTLTTLVNNIFMLIGFVAILILIYAGVKLIVSRGNEDAMKAAARTLLHVVIGIALILFSYLIVRFIVDILLRSNEGATTGEFDPTRT